MAQRHNCLWHDGTKAGWYKDTIQCYKGTTRWYDATKSQYHNCMEDDKEVGQRGTADKHNNQMETRDSVKDDNEDEEDKDDNYKENEDDKDKVGGEVEVEQRLGMQQSN